MNRPCWRRAAWAAVLSLGALALPARLGAAGGDKSAAAGGDKPAAAAKAAAFSVPAPTRTLLKNGLTLLVLERRAIPLVEFRLMVKAGAVSDPPGKEGTAALTARLLRRGTKSRSAAQFAEEVEFVGGTVDVDSASETTVATGEFASRDLEVALNLLADLAIHPTFTPDEFEKEKRQLLADLRSEADDPEAIADRAFQSWVYGGHPYGRPAEGTLKSVAAIGRDDVASFYEARYAPNNAILVIVGDVSAQQAVQRATNYFGGWGKHNVAEARIPEATPFAGRKVLLVDKPDATQCQIRLGNVALRRADPEYFPLLVGNAVLGNGFTSWLVDEVRVKRGLTYSIRSQVDAGRAAGTLRITTFSKNVTVLDTINATLEQVARLRDKPPPAEDLDKARSYLAGLYPLRIESPDALAAEILKVEFYGLGPDAINGYQKQVRAAGLDAVRHAAQRFVPSKDLAVVVVGPAAELRKGLEALGPVTVETIDAALGGA